MSDHDRSPCLTDPTGREHPLTSDVTTIGRAVENDIVITSRRVSREHAHLRREGWRVILEDLGSTNGTFLNDERVLSLIQLRDEDRIRVGDVTFIFRDPATTIRETPFPELEIDVSAGVVHLIITMVSASVATAATRCVHSERSRRQPRSFEGSCSSVRRERSWFVARRLRAERGQPIAPRSATGSDAPSGQ